MSVLIKKIWKMKYRKKVILSLGGIILILFSIWYLYLFNQKVIRFNDRYLRQIKLAETIQYKGNYLLEPIQIIVQKTEQNQETSQTIVEYYLPNDLYFKYFVFIDTINEYKQKIKILENDTEIFNGFYLSSSEFLYTDTMQPYIPNNSIIVKDGNYYPYSKDYKPSLYFTVALAKEDIVKTRGNIGPMILFVLTAILFFIDIKFPLFFFHLNLFLTAKNPEPTDFYIAIQKFSWYIIFPIILGIYLFLGLK